MPQNAMHKKRKKIFFNDKYTNTKPNSLCNFLALDIAKIKGHPLACLYHIVGWGGCVCKPILVLLLAEVEQCNASASYIVSTEG